MEHLIDVVVSSSSLIVPILAAWAVIGLYTQPAGCQCPLTQLLYFVVLILIAVLTVRTVATDANCWIVHTASLGMMIVAGAMRKPAAETYEQGPSLLSDP